MRRDVPYETWNEILTEKFSDGVTPLDTPFEIPQFQVDPKRLLEVAGFLKDEGFDMLLDLGGVDYLPRSPRFEIVYHLMRMEDTARIRLRCSPPDDALELATLSSLWPTAEPAEREVYDLFGVSFKGHPNLTRIMMPYDWEGHPLRKDYPLKGDREQTWAEFPSEKTRFHKPRLGEEG